jgi:hypothetical protein
MLIAMGLLAAVTVLQAVDLHRRLRHGSIAQSPAARAISWVATGPTWKVLNLGLTATSLSCGFLLLRPQHRRLLRVVKGQCPGCGYARNGLSRTVVCPECGVSPVLRKQVHIGQPRG